MESKTKKFLQIFLVSLCSIFIIFLSCSVAFVNASAVGTLAEILIEVFGEEVLEWTIEKLDSYIEDNNTANVLNSEQLSLWVTARDNYYDLVATAVPVSCGIHVSSSGNEHGGHGGSFGLPEDSFNSLVGSVSSTATVKDVCDVADGKNVGVTLPSDILSLLYSNIKDFFDMYALADEIVSTTIASAEEFESTDLSILANITLSGDYDMKIIRCGKGAFYACGTEFLKSNYSFLSNQYRSYYSGNYSYHPSLFYKVGDFIFVIQTAEYHMPSNFINFLFEDICLSTNLGGNFIQYQDTYSVRIWTTSGLSCNVVLNSDLGGYVFQDSSGNVFSNAFTNAKDCFVNSFLGLDIDTYEPTIDLDYYPLSSSVIEPKTIVVNNTYNTTNNSTLTPDYVNNLDNVGTLVNPPSDNTDLDIQTGGTNVTINFNKQQDDTEWDKVGEAIQTWDWSSLDISNWDDLLSVTGDYFALIGSVFSYLPSPFVSIIGLGLSFAILCRIFGR